MLPDSLYQRPIPERHRIVFYIGHLEAFDWNLLRDGQKSFNPEFDRLFAFGIDPVGGGLPTDQPADWPTLEKVHEYVARVRDTLDSHLFSASQAETLQQTDGNFPVRQLLNVAIEHRLMHAETLTYMLHQLGLEHKVKKPHAPELVSPPISATMIQVPAGSATLGLPRNANTFGWDNEFDQHVVDVPAFAIDRYKVTNAQFLEFMAAGGYDNQAHWTEDDWNWKTQNKISHPVFWRRVDNGWLYRTMFDDVPLPHEWPVYVSHAEASAYARWARKSLPTEAQWHRAAYGTPEGLENRYPWGDDAPNSKRGNFDFKSWDPAPVAAFPDGQSSFGIDGLVGNGWEWTSTLFAPFPGFQPFPFYRGYSADFFDGKHYVMKGGSARTAACMLRRSFRNWFQPRYQYVYAGFRCVSA